MKKFTDFIVDKRNYILVLFIILTGLCIFLMGKVKINRDLSEYLPNNSETKIGKRIMEDEFKGEESSSLNIMFKDLSDEEKDKIYEELSNTKDVSSVEYENSEEYNKDNYTLYIINVPDTSDGKKSKEVYKTITKKYSNYDIKTSGDISSSNKSVLKMWIVVFAISCAMIILIIMCDSYIHPFLILFTVGLAVFINKGTNIMFNNVSHITDSIVAILQMALSMDYAIMLINRFAQEKEKTNDKVKAMKVALSKSFASIASSSVTTIVGLLALVFMSFTIGRDLGFVLAKGVLFSLICILFCLPSLLLLFDNLIEKTKKKVFNPQFIKLGKFEYKIRYISIPLLIILFAGSYFIKGNLGILYTGKENDEVAKVFTPNNQMALIYKNEDEKEVAKYCKKLEDNNDVEQVLCYGNTIGEDLTYDELLNKLESLGTDVDIEDYLVKLIYYNYYNKDNDNNISFEQFYDFINEKIDSNKKISDKLDNNSKDNINKLKYFIKSNEYNKKRSSKEIANILGISEDKIDLLFIYYGSKNNNTKLTIGEFVNFINKDVLTNKEYSKEFSAKDKKDLNTLKKFTDKKVINNKLNSKDMAKLFDIDKSLVDRLYTYYLINNEVSTKMTINTFINFVLNDVSKDKNYSSYLDKDTINNLKTLKPFTNKNYINKKISINELSNTFNLDKESTKGILFLYYINQDNSNTYTLKQLLNYIINIKNNTNYLDDTDLSSFINLKTFINNENNINNTKLDKNTLSYIFNNISNGLVDKVYYALSLPDNYKLSPNEFVNLVINNMSNYLDQNSLNKLKLLKYIIDDSTSPKKYSVNSLSNIFGIDTKKLNKLYNLIDYTTNNTSKWKMSSKDFVNLILNNKDNNLLKGKIDSKTINKLTLLSNVMKYTNNNTKLDYKTLAKILNTDSSTTKQVYSIYESKNYKLSPTKFVKFIINHKNDNLLKNKISSDMNNKLLLVDKVMDSTNNNKKYNTKELSSLLNMNKDDLDLLYSLYSYTYNGKTKININTFVKFVINDVMNNKKYSNKFNEDSRVKLNAVNLIITSSINNTKYNSNDLYNVLHILNDSIEKNMIDLLYIYYGSEKEYNNNWVMTVESFVNYIYDDILSDNRFKDFIDNDIKDKIKSSKEKLDDSKKLLVGNNYSRLVINTKLDEEGNKTFTFINNIKDDLNTSIDDFYFIGNSPMALDMSKSFGRELDFITILTMIAIFIAVAVTFKDLLIPLILVLIIQCAVYLTMGVLSLLGGTVYFIALLIVQSILMGATIDYAIVFTSYYKESRQKLSVKDSILNAYSKSIHTILTSSSILIIVTLIVGNFASAIAAKICKTLSQGTLCSVILILVLLPAMLAMCDKLIIRKKSKFLKD